MGTKRVGLARVQTLIQNLKRELQMGESSLTGLAFLAGKVPDTVPATAHGAQLSEGTFVRVNSAGDAHQVLMFNAKRAGQLVFVTNVDDAQDAVLRNVADDTTLATIGEGKGVLCISTAAGDNWVVAIAGA